MRSPSVLQPPLRSDCFFSPCRFFFCAANTKTIRRANGTRRGIFFIGALGWLTPAGLDRFSFSSFSSANGWTNFEPQRPMNFLPLADRELRITARKARTYWLRSAIALGTMAMGTVFIVMGFSGIINPSSGGKAFFESMSVVLYVGVTLDTLTAASSLGRERRENTLGLLFLTPLKSYDVVAGKLAGVLVHQFYGLLAALPVISTSFFIGGVSSSDFMRMAIALPNALFFSSTLGLLTGACIQRESRAVGGAVAMSVLCCIGLPIVGSLLKPASLAPIFLVPTPAGAFVAALGSGFGSVSPNIFWWSLLVSQLMSWSFLILAFCLLRKSIQEKGFAPERQSPKMQTLSEKKT